MGVFTGGTSFRPGFVVFDSRNFVPPLISLRRAIAVISSNRVAPRRSGKTNHVEEMQLLISAFDFALWIDK